MGSGSSTSLTHLWTLDNFSHLYHENCQWKWEVESEVFTVPGNEDLKFSLAIWPKVKGEDGEEYLGLGLSTKEMPAMWEGKVTLKERCCIVDEDGGELWGKGYAEREVFSNLCTFDYEYLRLEKLLNSSTGYIKGGTIRLLFEMTFNSPEAIFNSPDNTHTFSVTTIPSSVSSLSHCLTLSHFKWLSEDNKKQMPLKVQSKYFNPERDDIGKLQLEFYPKGKKGIDEENVGIGIRNENTYSLNVHFEYFLLDVNGDKFHQYENTGRLLPNIGESDPLPRHRLLSLLDSLPTDELTINCHVTVLGKGEQDRAPSHTTSTHLALFTYHYVSYTWTIEQFLAQRHRQNINSKYFSPSTDSRYKFILRLYPNKDKVNVILALYFTSTSSLEVSTVNCICSVVDAKEDGWNARVGTHFISKSTEFGFYKLISYRTLHNFASLLLPEDKLTIKCELWINEPRKELPPELLNPPSASLSPGGTQVTIIDSQFAHTIFAAGSTLSTGNITSTSSSTTAETSQHK